MSGRNTQSVQVKVKRYWPGKVPEGADVYSDYSSSGDEAGTKTSDFSKTGKVSARVDEPVVETEQETITIETMNPESIQSDRRLQRLQQTKKPSKVRDISSRYDQEDKSSADDSGEDDIEDSRARIKREALLRQREIEKTLEVTQEAASEEETEEEESEYTTESSDEEDDMMPMFKPVFVPKSQRVTIFEKERKEAELFEAERLRDLEKQLRKKESAKMVQELIKQELEEATYKAQAITEADDTDGINEEAEYEAWKLRELMRIKRDVEEKAELAREKAEIERRRNMTEEERTREDLEKVRQQDEAKFERQQNTKQVFLQKYHHKGAFFMDKDEEVYKRNFHEAAESEVFHRELLPQVMQVKNFGLAGRTKYTHLGDQDTTKDSPWNQVDPSVNSTLRKLGGLHDLVEHKVYKAPRRDEPEQGNFSNPGQYQGQNQYQGQGSQYQGQGQGQYQARPQGQGSQYQGQGQGQYQARPQGQGSQYQGQGQGQYQARPQGQNQNQYQDSRQSRDKK